MPKIVIDRAIPYIQGIFEPYAEVQYIDGKSFTANIVKDADALIIRTRTKCNASLLASSKVQHIATATIGFDHIDLDYCKAHNIEVSTAAGCNARAVLQWVAATLAHLSKKGGWSPCEKRIGVVGVGNVGSLVAEYCELWGFDVVCSDPPRQQREGGDFISIEDIAASCDIITLHTPLDDTTHHLVDSELLAKTKSEAIIINSSRGEVVDTRALLDSGREFVLDVWEQEPNIDADILAKATLATPHIAGYSKQGKSRATEMAVTATARALNIPITEWQCKEVEPTTPQPISWNVMLATIEQRVDIEVLSDNLKCKVELFEFMRDNYNYRNDYF